MSEPNEILNVIPEDLPNNPDPDAYEPALNIAGRIKRDFGAPVADGNMEGQIPAPGGTEGPQNWV